MARRMKGYRILRWAVQLLFLFGFILLFGFASYGYQGGWQNLFFRFDPLILLTAGIAGRVLLAGLLPSLLVVFGTLLFGRFFCGFVCPLGTSIDLADAAIPHRRKPARLTNGKYLILLFLVSAAVLRASFLHFFDPLVITGRTLALGLYPAAGYLFGTVAGIRPVAFTETALAVGMFVLILGLGWLGRRFWCRNLCPLGGLLGVLAKSSLFRFHFKDGQCTDCRVCDKVCPTGAVDSEKRELDAGDCIGCLACHRQCPGEGIGFGFRFRTPRFRLKTRQAVGAVLAALVLVPLANTSPHGRLQAGLVRPPGSIPEAGFANRCLHCGLCLKACPTNGLQPCVLEAGVNGIWSPRLVPRIGGCEKNCNMCGQVCPTGAIRRLELEEKTFAVMGRAVVDRGRCLAWEQDKHCLICDEACPFDAIDAVSDPEGRGAALRPQVDERICIGCGLCEARCPVEGPAAIRVTSIGEERRQTGSYITEQRRGLRECGEGREEEIPAGFILEEN